MNSQSHPAIAIVGLGLIGGSLALALRSHGIEAKIIGIDTDSYTRDKALTTGMVDAVYASIAETPPVDMLILATPVSSFAQLAVQCRQHLSPETTISDVGSTKCSLLQAFVDSYGELPEQLSPGHPIAGSEQSGVDAADAHLFKNACVIQTPTKVTSTHHYQRVKDMWQQLNCQLIDLSPEYHDLVLAQTSHLPHLLSFVLVYYLAHESENYDIFRFAAGGFRDFTRIASSDPVMWSSIFCANRDKLLPVIDGLQHTLSDLRAIIADGDTSQVRQFISEAKKARDYYTRTL